MRKEGTIVRWNDDKGFGFIRSGGVAQDVFVHARDFRGAGGEVPRQGLRVTFEDIHVGGKGPRAMAVQPALAFPAPAAARAHARAPTRASVPGRSRPPRSAAAAPGSGAWLTLPLMFAYGLLLAWAVWQRALPWWVLPASLLLNLATFFAYWQDKYAAQQRQWRVPEKTLHLFSLAGGWGGAWFAQQTLRHKSAKEAFRAVYWATVAAHCSAVAAWLWTGGSL